MTTLFACSDSSLAVIPEFTMTGRVPTGQGIWGISWNSEWRVPDVSVGNLISCDGLNQVISGNFTHGSRYRIIVECIEEGV